MQGSKSRSNSAEARQRTCPPTKLSRQQLVRSESSSSSNNSPSTRSPNRANVKIDHCSPANSGKGSQKKKAPTKIAELEEELKQVRDELITSELLKKRIQQEAEEAKRQNILLSEKLNETESQLTESSSLEESRIFELRKLSQERDRAWQNELEAMQKQHSLDSVALTNAMNEIFKLKGLVREREKERDAARTELEASKGTIDSLLVEGSKLMDSFGTVVRELEESRVQVKTLEEKLSSTEKAESRESDGKIETLEVKLYEEEILRTVQLQCIAEFIEQMKIESNERERKLEEAAISAKSEVVLLKASLFDKDCEVRKIMDMSKKNEAEAEANAKLNLVVTKLEEELGVKKKELEYVLYENNLLKSELTRLATEKDRICEQALHEKNFATKAQKEALAKLEMAVEEMKESKEKASVLNNELNSVQKEKAAMETELRKLRIQADQWKKAADMAMTLLTVGSKDKLIEQAESLNPNPNSNLNFVSGKLGSLDFSDELDDEHISRKNGNVLRKISGMWKK